MKLKLIEVGSTSCGVCKMMKPMVEKAISKFSTEDVEFIYINGDTEEGKEIMKQYSIENVSKVPSFFFFTNVENEWKCREQFDGGMTLPSFVEKIKSHLT